MDADVTTAAARVLQFVDPVLNLGTTDVPDKAFKGATTWVPSCNAAAQLRSAQRRWLASSSKAEVSQDDLDRLATLSAMLLSLAGIAVQQGLPPVPALKQYNVEWTSPLSVSQQGLVGAVVGVAAVAARVAASSAAAAATSAASGAPPAEVLRRALAAGSVSSQPPPQPDGDGLTPAALRTLWRAESIATDAAMWCFAYAVAVRQAGLQRCLGYAADPAAASAAAVQLLRQSAGLLDYYARMVLPAVDAEAALDAGRRPPELQRNVAACLGLVCLAEAQAITTSRAVDKGTSNATIAGLEAGTAQLYLMARMALCGLPVPEVSPAMGTMDLTFTPPASSTGLLNAVKRLATYIATAQALHQARSRAAQALDWESKAELGIAEACAKEGEGAAQAGLRLVRSVGQQAEPSWVEALQAQLGTVTTVKARVEKDRLNVSYQPLPKEVPASPAPKILVSKVATTPPPYIPPTPTPEEERQGQTCSVQ